jgi:hypothetical protein
LCEFLDRELESKKSKHGVYSKLTLMVENMRQHRLRGEDPMMHFLKNQDAWQGDSLINLYAVWSGVETMVINMATESKVQVRSSKGLLRSLGYGPGKSGPKAEPGATCTPALELSQALPETFETSSTVPCTSG